MKHTIKVMIVLLCTLIDTVHARCVRAYRRRFVKQTGTLRPSDYPVLCYSSRFKSYWWAVDIDPVTGRCKIPGRAWGPALDAADRIEAKARAAFGVAS